MADLSSTISRIGQDKGAGDALALFLKVYAGEVLTAFETKVTLKERTRNRELASGKSASFPMTFKASGGFHTPGTELTGRAIQHSEKIITIDDLMVSDTVIASIDEAMSHYDVRSIYSEEQGRFLAKQFDKNLSRILGKATQEAAVFSGDRGGIDNAVSAGATVTTDALVLADALWVGKQNIELGDVPVDSYTTYAALLPTQWYLLAREPSVVLNRDISANPGDYSKGTLETIGGVELVKSNNYRWLQNDSDLSAEDGAQPSADTTKYEVDLSATAGVVFTEHAVGTVNLMGLNMDSDWLVQNRGYFTVAEYAAGHGTLITKASAAILNT